MVQSWADDQEYLPKPANLLHGNAEVTEDTFLPQGCSSAAAWPLWAAARAPGSSQEILTGLQIKELLLQSEGCLEIFQNTEFSTIKKSEREDPGQTALTSTLYADSCCWGVFQIISLICSITKELLPHTFNAHTAQEVAEVTLHLPAGVLPSLRQFLDY